MTRRFYFACFVILVILSGTSHDWSAAAGPQGESSLPRVGSVASTYHGAS